MNAELPILGLLLAAIQLADALGCAFPVSARFTAYLGREFDRLQLSSGVQRAMPPVKAAAGVGLIAGLWLPLLGVVTGVALVIYFTIAIGAHLRVKDPPLKFVNAAAMLALSAAVLWLTYLPAV